MGGSKPDRAGSDDYATLEEVFASRSFGHAPSEVPARAVVPAVVSGASKPYFVRNRFVAAAAVAAAALSIVAGLSLGAGPAHHPVISAKSSGSPGAPSTTPPSTTTPGGAPAGGSGGSAGTGAAGAGSGAQPSQGSPVSSGGAPGSQVAAVGSTAL
jgi:hypothetical protein